MPDGRSAIEDAVTVEFFYKDADLTWRDKSGRRLYLGNEFNKKSGKHVSENVHTILLNKVRGGKQQKRCIIDDAVFVVHKFICMEGGVSAGDT